MPHIWILIAAGVLIMPIISKYTKNIEDQISKIETQKDSQSNDDIEKLKEKAKKMQILAFVFFISIAIILAYITKSMLPPM